MNIGYYHSKQIINIVSDSTSVPCFTMMLIISIIMYVCVKEKIKVTKLKTIGDLTQSKSR